MKRKWKEVKKKVPPKCGVIGIVFEVHALKKEQKVGAR